MLALFEIGFKKQKSNLDFQRIFDNPLANIAFPKSFISARTIFPAIFQSYSKHNSSGLPKKFFLKKLYGPFLGTGFNCLKDTEPLRGDWSLFTLRSPGGPGTHFMKLKRMKTESTLQPFTGFEPWTPWLGIQHLNH